MINKAIQIISEKIKSIVTLAVGIICIAAEFWMAKN